MSVRNVSLLSAIRLAKKHAKENPNKEAICRYVYADKPECIVGRILVDLGVSTEWLNDRTARFEVLADRVPGLTFDSDAIRFLDNVQSIQDNRPSSIRTIKGEWVSGLQDAPRTWRSAVNVALDVAGSKAARV